MKKESTSQRLKRLMADRNLRQVDILELCKPYCKKYNVKLGRNDLSQYVSGKVEPGQKKLTIISLALNVSEAWLMGFDSPMERDESKNENIITFQTILDEIKQIIEEGGYKISYSDNSPPDIIIKAPDNKLLTIANEHELVGRYFQLKGNGNFSPKDLWEDTKHLDLINKIHAFDLQLESLGWSYKIMVEPNPASKDHALSYALFKNDEISFKVSLVDCDKFINDAENFYKERIQQLLRKSMKQLFTENTHNNNSFMVNAAHERTDTEVTEEMKKHDDDIMNEDDF